MTELDAILARRSTLAIAVSGGVDSLTLAHAAARVTRVRVIHATSPAVPGDATDRVRRHATQAGWPLDIVTAGEFGDVDYLKNPVNRCYFCKTNLYARIADVTDAPIAAGTNIDDLGEYRPGLIAAAERNVLHPFVEARMAKCDVRALAVSLGLSDIAEIPAQPCLASRIETGIAIDADDLAFVDRIEREVTAFLGPRDIRCRITACGVRLEVDGPIRARPALTDLMQAACAGTGRVFTGIAPYRRGSAFLTDQVS